MTALSAFLDDLSDEQRSHFYLQLALIALEQYSMGECKSVFLQHNSGITYRINSANEESCFLLKIHEPIGTGPKASFEQIQARMEWLDKLVQTSDLIVQAPVPNKDGNFVTNVQVLEIEETIECTLQKWVEGEHSHRDFTLSQAESVGAMLAKLHQTSSLWQSSMKVSLEDYQASDLLVEVKQLHKMVGAHMISSTQFETMEQAVQAIIQIADLLGTDPQVYGPIHGDLHQENVLFYENDVRPIDFDALRNSYYLFDLGTTLYHILHQSVDFRKALIDGYSSVRALSDSESQFLEAFVTWSAMDNLSFQSTIPRQVKSKLFLRNLHQLADGFCPKVIVNKPFVLQ